MSNPKQTTEDTRTLAEKMGALEEKNVLLSACLNKAEKQRDALLELCKKSHRALLGEHISGLPSALRSAIAAVESGKVPT